MDNEPFFQFLLGDMTHKTTEDLLVYPVYHNTFDYMNFITGSRWRQSLKIMDCEKNWGVGSVKTLHKGEAYCATVYNFFRNQMWILSPKLALSRSKFMILTLGIKGSWGLWKNLKRIPTIKILQLEFLHWQDTLMQFEKHVRNSHDSYNGKALYLRAITFYYNQLSYVNNVNVINSITLWMQGDPATSSIYITNMNCIVINALHYSLMTWTPNS